MGQQEILTYLSKIKRWASIKEIREATNSRNLSRALKILHRDKLIQKRKFKRLIVCDSIAIRPFEFMRYYTKYKIR
jgi:hypothetical protein